MSDDESIDESEQQTEEQPADSDRAAEQSEEQPADGDQQSAQSDDGPADNDQPADQSDEQPAEKTDQPEQQTDHQPAEDQLEPLRGEPMDEAMRNKLELDLESADVTPATAKTGDCSSWENDPRGFAKAIADNYLRTEFDHMPGVVAPEGMSCWSSRPGGKVSDFCYLHYSDGWNVIVSLGNIPDYVKARAIAPERKPMCTYSYDCTDTGVLVFTRRGCYA